MPSDTWTTNDTYVHNGKTMVKGTEFAIAGERGARFRFQDYVVTADGRCWINAIGGQHKVVMFRAFRPSQISRITRLTPIAARFR
jgi:hypothetical protein